MEVHHHPHVHSDSHGKKNFKEYFLEFIMIFLAVTLGFIAENLREHYTEKANAKEYARLFLNDLAADTAEFNRTIHVLNRIINAGDSFANLVSRNEMQRIPAGNLYYHEYWSSWQWRVTPRDATLKQLESSGALRYLGKAALIKKILDYEESLKVIALLENNQTEDKSSNWKLVQKVFNGKYFVVLDNIKSAAHDSSSNIPLEDTILHRFLQTDLPLLTNDKSEMIELSNWAINSSRSSRTLLKTVSFAKEKAIEAMDALKKEYGFR